MRAPSCGCARTSLLGRRKRYRDELEVVDSLEVIWIARVQRKVVGDGNRCDHRVIGPCGTLATSGSKRGCDATEGTRSRCVERERVEVCLGLLEVRLAGGTLLVVCCDKWAD